MIVMTDYITPSSLFNIHCFMCSLATVIIPKANCRFHEISCSHRNCGKFNTKVQPEIQEFAVFMSLQGNCDTQNLKQTTIALFLSGSRPQKKEESLSNVKSEHMCVHTNVCISQVEFL